MRRVRVTTLDIPIVRFPSHRAQACLPRSPLCSLLIAWLTVSTE